MKLLSFKTLIGITIGILLGYFIFQYLTIEDTPLQQANILATHNKPEEAKEIYQQLAQNPREPEDLEADYHLAELYYNQSRSDSDPILHKAIAHYKKAIKNGFIDAMFPLANIYNYCAIPETNKKLAQAIYQEVIASPHATNSIKNRAHEKLVELNQELQVTDTHQNRFQTPQPPAQVLANHQIPVNPEQPRQIIHIPPTRVRNDSQNVHDSGLQKTFLAGYNNLRRLNSFNKVRIPQREIDEHIKNYVKTNTTINPTVKETALKALEYMRKTNQSITNLQGASEMEVLTNVYNRIYSSDNKANKEKLKEILITQLAESMPKNQNDQETPVCAQGRATRVFSIFQAVDPQSEQLVLKPKWVLKEELSSLASNVRDSFLQNLPKNRQDNYNTDGGDNPQSQNDAIKITNEIKEEIQKRASEYYVSTNIMKYDELEKELKPLLENI